VPPDRAISGRAYARLRGVSHTAVQQRIKAGSLPTSAKKIKDRWVIVDVDLANAEWETHTRPWVSANGGTNGSIYRAALAEVTLRERMARAESIELETARRKGALVPARKVELRWSAHVVAVRTAMLAIPSRYKQRVPHATTADLDILDKLIREALEELADGAAL
jgi:phage terminase Nu1 subunit (DNA packaging protein)